MKNMIQERANLNAGARGQTLKCIPVQYVLHPCQAHDDRYIYEVALEVKAPCGRTFVVGLDEYEKWVDPKIYNTGTMFNLFKQQQAKPAQHCQVAECLSTVESCCGNCKIALCKQHVMDSLYSENIGFHCDADLSSFPLPLVACLACKNENVGKQRCAIWPACPNGTTLFLTVEALVLDPGKANMALRSSIDATVKSLPRDVLEDYGAAAFFTQLKKVTKVKAFETAFRDLNEEAKTAGLSSDCTDVLVLDLFGHQDGFDNFVIGNGKLTAPEVISNLTRASTEFWSSSPSNLNSGLTLGVLWSCLSNIAAIQMLLKGSSMVLVCFGGPAYLEECCSMRKSLFTEVAMRAPRSSGPPFVSFLCKAIRNCTSPWTRNQCQPVVISATETRYVNVGNCKDDDCRYDCTLCTRIYTVPMCRPVATSSVSSGHSQTLKRSRDSVSENGYARAAA